MTDGRPVDTMIKEFDLYAHEPSQDPYPMYDKIRSACPVAHSDVYGGYYFATRFDTVKEIYSNFRRFTSDEGVGLPPQVVKMYPLDIDPPEQTKYRKVLNPFFSPQAAASKRSEAETIVNELIDKFIETGSSNLTDDLIRPTLAAIVLPHLGVPLRDKEWLRETIDFMIRQKGSDVEATMRANDGIRDYLIDLTARRRTEPRVDDVLDMLIHTKIDNEYLSDYRIYTVLLILLTGGLDTTTAVVSEALVYLSRHRDEGAKLLNGELEWGPAIEEFVRYASPVQGLRRVTRSDIELEGVKIGPGESVLAVQGAANRDPEHFAEPHRCVLDRPNNDHLGFGAGAHICIGRHFARVGIEVLVGAVLRRMPDYSVAPDFVPEYVAGETRGMVRLPIRFTPGKRLAA